MKTGQVIHIKRNDVNHYWHIESICYGGTNQESVIHIGRADGKTPPDCLGKRQAMFVPEVILTELIECGKARVYEPFENDDILLTA